MATDKELIDAWGNMSKEQQIKTPVSLQKKIAAAKKRNTKTVGEKIKEGAIAGSGIDEIGGALSGLKEAGKVALSKNDPSMFPKLMASRQDPKELEKAKLLAKLPINLVTALPGAVGGAVMGGTGLSEKIGEQLSKLSPKQQKSAETVLEILGTAATRGTKIPKIRKVKLGDLQKQIKQAEKTTSSKIVEELTEGVDTFKKKFKKEVVAPAREGIETAVVSENIGKVTAREIDNLIKSTGRKLTDQEKALVNKIKGDVSTAKNIKDVLDEAKKAPRTAKQTFKTDDPTFGDTIARQVKNIMEEKAVQYARKAGKGAEADEYIRVMKAYGPFKDVSKALKGIENANDIRFFETYLRGKGTKRLKALNESNQNELSRALAMKYIVSEMTDKNGKIITKNFNNAVEKIGDERGKIIFGKDWVNIKSVSKGLDLLETPAQKIGTIPVLRFGGVVTGLKWIADTIGDVTLKYGKEIAIPKKLTLKGASRLAKSQIGGGIKGALEAVNEENK